MPIAVIHAATELAVAAATDQEAQLTALMAPWAGGPMVLRYYSAADVLLDTVTHGAPAINYSTTPLQLEPGAITARTFAAADTAAYVIAAVPAGADILRATVAMGAAVLSAARTSLVPQSGAMGLVIWADSGLQLGIATTLALSMPSTGTAGTPVTVTVTPNGPVAGGGTATLATDVGTLGSTTSTWTAGESAAKTTTLMLDLAGTASVTLTTGTGLSISGSPAGFTATAPITGKDLILDDIAAAADNTWVKLNPTGDTFSGAWPNSDYTPLYNGGVQAGQSAVIRAWSSYAWDSVGEQFILWGGGHANTNYNGLFVWPLATRSWTLGYHASDIAIGPVVAGYPAGIMYPVDGYLSAPVSSHTYSSQVHLAGINRFVTFGGASYPDGATFQNRNTSTGALIRYLGPWACDLSQAGTGKVGGTTGSNVHRGTTAAVDLTGANAWSNWDFALDHSQAALFAGMVDHINGWADAVTESAHDVIYVTGDAAGGTSHDLFKIDVTSTDYHAHTLTQVGRWSGGASSRYPVGCVHVAKNLAVSLATAAYPILLWDLSTAGPTNNNIMVAAADITGTGASALVAAFSTFSISYGGCAGMCYDSTRGVITLYLKSGEVLDLIPPATAPWTTGWTCTLKAASSITPHAPLYNEMGGSADAASDAAPTSVEGKWRFIPALRCPVLLTHNNNGELWAFRPTGWTDPRP